MLGRSTGLEGEGNVNGEGVEDYELRQRLDRAGKDITGNPKAQDELIHGAKKVMKEKDQTENGVIADEETEIPETCGCDETGKRSPRERTAGIGCPHEQEQEIPERAAFQRRIRRI